MHGFVFDPKIVSKGGDEWFVPYDEKLEKVLRHYFMKAVHHEKRIELLSMRRSIGMPVGWLTTWKS